MKNVLLVVLAIFLLSGCGCLVKSTPTSQGPSVTYPTIPQPPKPVVAPAPPPAPAPAPKAVVPPPAPAPKAVLKPVYFDVAKWVIRKDAEETLKNNAVWFKENPGKKVTISGNCDPRGANKYNLILGQKRAETVKDYLMKLGVSGNMLNTVTYGKDKPICKEQKEDCWKTERRVDFIPVP
jgi:peptidoglycan-associated lipoprotein